MAPETELSGPDFVSILTVRTHLHGDQAVLSPRGEIDCVSVRLLDQALDGLPAVANSVTLDIAEVTFMDSAGLHFVERLQDFGQRRRIPARTRNWGSQPRRLRELVHPQGGPSSRGGPAPAPQGWSRPAGCG
ncbi:STAS domain-containing protein [Streptomyces sp. NPDC007100]|uniref:STAS domain-containing protein n=1 Tax=unclassified Streptomyces TaxID=2593676 RepID=UPI0034077CF6